jgi:GntR family transcriptional regulator, transcriptional repressor for pyruvate dehydrogenase complex
MARRPIERRTLADHIADQLRSDILAGRFTAGAPLPPQRQLASDFGASTNVVREALRTLQADGLIDIRHGAGMFVNDLSSRLDADALDVEALMEARCMLEVGAVERVMQRLDEEALGRFDEILDRAARKLEQGRPVLEEELDFHRTVLELSGNPAVVHLASIIEDFFCKAIADRPPEVAGIYPAFVPEHRMLIDFFLAGDLPAARRALCDHIMAGHPK